MIRNSQLAIRNSQLAIRNSPLSTRNSQFAIRNFSKAFTLIELLIVIAIIGVLAGVLMATFGGATESARAAQCLTNMRSLALAANACAMKSGYYPLAGSREVVDLDVTSGQTLYRSQPGWISWLCEGNYEEGNAADHATSHQSNPIAPFYGNGNEKDMTFALTNGTLWVSSSRDKALYVCPTHALYWKNHKRPTIYWSYAMNARFGWDTTKGSRAIGSSSTAGAVRYNTLTRADKTLMFAELPTVDPVSGEDVGEDKNGLESDCVLQYKAIQANTKNKSKGSCSSDDGSEEAIGFVHKNGKHGRCAHVAFADGHTEKLIWRTGESGTDLKTLTAYLCRGWDVTFDGKSGWKLADGADQMD